MMIGCYYKRKYVRKNRFCLVESEKKSNFGLAFRVTSFTKICAVILNFMAQRSESEILKSGEIKVCVGLGGMKKP